MRIKVCLIFWFKWSRARSNIPSEVNASYFSIGLSIHTEISSPSFCIKNCCQEEDEGSGGQLSPKPYQTLLSSKYNCGLTQDHCIYRVFSKL